MPWWTPPGETDTTAYAALILLFLLVFAVFHFSARFDLYAERHNEGTPLKTTIPMLLLIAFAYEIFPPLSHFSILLPLALIATALARDHRLGIIKAWGLRIKVWVALATGIGLAGGGAH